MRIERLQALAVSLTRCAGDGVAVRSVLAAVHQLLSHPDAGIAVLGSGTAVPCFTRLLSDHAADAGLAQSLLSILELAAGVPGGGEVLASAGIVPALVRVLQHLTDSGGSAGGVGSDSTAALSAPLLAACTLLLRVAEEAAGRTVLASLADDDSGIGDVAATLAAAAGVCAAHDPALAVELAGLAAALER